MSVDMALNGSMNELDTGESEQGLNSRTVYL